MNDWTNIAGIAGGSLLAVLVPTILVRCFRQQTEDLKRLLWIAAFGVLLLVAAMVWRGLNSNP